MANWFAPDSHLGGCHICERHSYVQIFYRAAAAEQEFSEIRDQRLCSKLIEFYGLDKSEFKVPIIFGSLIGNWKKWMPMLFITHYA